jgi:hypothetical protein
MKNRADICVKDIVPVNIRMSLDGSTLRGTTRLLRDLVSVGLMQERFPGAGERLQSKLGAELATAVRASLVGAPGPVHADRGLRPRRAA